MRHLLTETEVVIPEAVTVGVQSRVVTVKGPLGSLKRAFKHASISILKPKDNKLKLQIWQAQRKQRACLTAIASQIKNMIRGVTEGYKFKMKLAYAHFPIQDFVSKDGKSIEIKHFLGEKRVRRIDALEGVQIIKKEERKKYSLIFGRYLCIRQKNGFK
ncbi:ribosomal protein, putative [Ichthyophthirius multifiliis]|uniref:Ribosomal protein, putative n=1 Tax=Ichthyophthirius multifiliis TaxID=5932 RepID=G0QWZ0_ICHMU|nr:ribosomal protein, putative [Ichthyophthirius multifiliis]EGR30271.1 ribosomal protein, putative [Ichthyophthirius multifiliis]|eukprot:XP_004065517.1 ribosomal protein, putative [Ichthyophthirius multifiliis]